MPINVPTTTLRTIGPERRASRPTTILLFFIVQVLLIKVAYADVNFTMSKGVRPLLVAPPIVPRMPEIDLIKVIINDIIGIYGYHRSKL